MANKTPWIGTSWKMNKTRAQARAFADLLAGSPIAKTQAAKLFVIPPFTAISDVASDRANIGAGMQRIEYNVSQLGTLNNNLAAASSRISDVDVAEESTVYARENILVQTGTAMLAQANSQPESVLRLLS